jgi:predicted thioesterase
VAALTGPAARAQLIEAHLYLVAETRKRHFAATPVGLRVAAAAEVTAVEGRTVTFRVEARDEREVIGDGTHQRVVVNVARFDDRVRRKLGRPG